MTECIYNVGKHKCKVQIYTCFNDLNEKEMCISIYDYSRCKEYPIIQKYYDFELFKTEFLTLQVLYKELEKEKSNFDKVVERAYYELITLYIHTLKSL